MFRVSEHHVPETTPLEDVIRELLPYLEIDHKPQRIFRGGIIIELRGRYQPCAECGRPRTISPDDGREYCNECNLRSYAASRKVHVEEGLLR